MRQLARTAVTPVWVLLVLATAASWWLGADQGLGASLYKLATTLVMTVAFMKVAFVGLYFMEFRHAPLGMKLLFGTWCTIFLTAVLGFYWLG